MEANFKFDRDTNNSNLMRVKILELLKFLSNSNF